MFDKMSGPSGVISTDIGPNHNAPGGIMADESIKLIPLGPSGRFAIIDEGDAELVSTRKWRLVNGYVRSHLFVALGPEVYIHRLIMNPPRDRVVDHINGNRLDNRKSNLRVCTNADNCRNSGKWKRSHETTSRFKGVSWQVRPRKWQAHIHVLQQHFYLGVFDDEQQAAKAYDAAAIFHFGAFARVNFPC